MLLSVDMPIIPAMTKLIAVGGPTGAGKTTLGYRLAAQVPALAGALVLDNDLVRRELRGHDLRTIMQDEDYTPEVTAQVRARLDVLTREALAQGRDVIDTSGFWGPEVRAHIRALAESCGALFIGIWLDVSRAELERRITKRLAERAREPILSSARGHASDAEIEVLDKYAAIMPLAAPDGWHRVDASASEDSVLRTCTPYLALLC